MENGLTSSGSACWCSGEGLEGSDDAVAVGEVFSDVGFEVVEVVMGGFTVVIVWAGFGIVAIPPARLNLARVAILSLFGSCCLRYAANASKGTIAGICGVGIGCNRCGLGDRVSAVARTSGGLSPVVDAGLLVAFFFAMVRIGGGSLFPVVVHGGFFGVGWWLSRAVVLGERMHVRVCKVKGSKRLGVL